MFGEGLGGGEEVGDVSAAASIIRADEERVHSGGYGAIVIVAGVVPDVECILRGYARSLQRPVEDLCVRFLTSLLSAREGELKGFGEPQTAQENVQVWGPIGDNSHTYPTTREVVQEFERTRENLKEVRIPVSREEGGFDAPQAITLHAEAVHKDTRDQGRKP